MLRVKAGKVDCYYTLENIYLNTLWNNDARSSRKYAVEQLLWNNHYKTLANIYLSTLCNNDARSSIYLQRRLLSTLV